MIAHSGQIKHFSSVASLETTYSLKQIVTSLQANMPNHNVVSYFEQKPTLLAEASDIIIAWDDPGSETNVVGLMTLRHYMAQKESPDFVHISTIHIAQARQRGTLLKRLITFAFLSIWKRVGNLPTWTVLKTFNPSTYNVLLKLKRMIGSGVMLYPDLQEKNETCNLTMVQIATSIAARLEPECAFDNYLSVIHNGGGIVGGNYWLTAPRSSHHEINDFFDRCLTPSDRMLCIFGLDDRLGKPAALQLFAKWSSDNT